MLEFLGLGKAPAPLDPTDEVVALPWFDAGFAMQTTHMYAFFTFDDVVDPDTLRAAGDRLVAREGWRKLGGRLRKNATTGDLEIRIPQTFTKERPGVHFYHVHHDMPAASHPIGALIPKPCTGSPTVVGDPEALSEFMRCANGGPIHLNDYLAADRPMLGLTLTTFTDRSCLSISWPHLLLDAMALNSVISGLEMELHGRSDIPVPHDIHVDHLAPLGHNPSERHFLADYCLTMLNKAVFALRNIYSFVGPKEARIVCIPTAFWQKMVADVREDLAREAKQAGEAEAPFVTEGDVLTAWWTRILIASYLGRQSATTVVIQNVMSIRKALAGDLLDADRPYLGNALTFPTVMREAQDIMDRPLSWLALEFRRSIESQGTRGQIDAFAWIQRNLDPALRMPLLFGHTGMYAPFFSNWNKARFYEFDFAPAMARPRSEPLYASYVHCAEDPVFCEGWIFPGKDVHGNHWMTGVRAKGLWAKIEAELAKQTEGENL